MDVWDLTNTSYGPTSEQNVCSPQAITCVAPAHLLRRTEGATRAPGRLLSRPPIPLTWCTGGRLTGGTQVGQHHRLMAVGTANGGLHLMDLPKGLFAASAGEVTRLHLFPRSRGAIFELARVCRRTVWRHSLHGSNNG